MAQSKIPEWRGKEWDSDLPLWHTDHPLHKVLPNDKPVEVGSQSVTARVTAPNIDDPDLRDCIAKTAAIDLLEEASDLAPTVALESFAILFLHIGGATNPTALKTYNASLGIEPAPQASNDFQPLLKFVAGQAWDSSNKKAPARVSKMASLLTYWAKYHADDPAYTPFGDNPGTSPFARWVLDDCGGYGGFANFPQPVPPPVSWVKDKYIKMEDTFNYGTDDGTVLRLVGHPKEIPVFLSRVEAHWRADAEAADKARSAVWLDADDPDAALWDILEWDASIETWGFTASDYSTRDRKAIGERLAYEIARRSPQPTPAAKPSPGVSPAKNESKKTSPPATAKPPPVISPEKTEIKKPPIAPPKADWSHPQSTATHRPPITGTGIPAPERPTIRQSEHRAELDRLRETQRRAKESWERELVDQI
jgi:hypothetical protein